jgi:D-3-phosphoglycerate dehydrogenase
MRILVTAPFHQEFIDRLKESAEIFYENWRDTGILEFDSSELTKRINEKNIDIIITEADEVDKEVIENTNLKLIASTRGTPVNVDRESASSKKIPILFTPHRNADAVADLTILLMLSQARKIIPLDRLLKTGKFDISDLEEEEFANFYNKYQGFELGNQTVGIIGFGAIGSKVAHRLFHGFGSKIVYYDPYIKENNPTVVSTRAESLSLEELMKIADLITLHTPPVEETEELLGEKEFALMKPTAHFFNLARSFCIDEDALFTAIKEKRLAGAGLDVFDQEPVDSDNRFLEFDNVTVTPHIGGNTKDVIYHQSKIITEDVTNFLEGKKLVNIWNSEIYN